MSVGYGQPRAAGDTIPSKFQAARRRAGDLTSGPKWKKKASEWRAVYASLRAAIHIEEDL